MFLEMAVADAYAIGWEFTKSQQTAPVDLSQFVQHPTYVELKPGQYTDDTQRSIANAQVMLAAYNRINPEPNMVYDPTSYAYWYIKAYNQDPREGYSRGYQAFLNSFKEPKDFLLNIRRTKDSNGSVMGVAPLGFLPDINIVKMAAMIQATSTHHVSTVVHAQIVALSVHYFVHMKHSRAGLFNWLIEQVDWLHGSDERLNWQISIDDYATNKPTSIKASSISAYMLYALEKFDKLSDIIVDATSRGGDTDSAAAVAVAVASCCPEVENDIPQHLIESMDLANPGFGVKYLTDLENELSALFGIDR